MEKKIKEKEVSLRNLRNDEDYQSSLKNLNETMRQILSLTINHLDVGRAEKLIPLINEIEACLHNQLEIEWPS